MTYFFLGGNQVVRAHRRQKRKCGVADGVEDSKPNIPDVTYGRASGLAFVMAVTLCRQRRRYAWVRGDWTELEGKTQTCIG